MTHDRAVTIAALLALLTGCGVDACLDMLVPRPVTPIAGPRVVTLAYGDQPPVRVTVSCERYYDAQCSTRGNSWDVREVGSEGPPELVRFITVQDPVLGEVKIPRPGCELYGRNAPRAFQAMVMIRGKTYFYLHTEDAGHVFERRKFARQQMAPSAIHRVVLPFTLAVDGKALPPPEPPAAG
jgi:hypothetical protein